MTGKWSLLVPGLVIAAAGICGCSTAAGPSGTASPLRLPPSSASSAKAAECTASSLALADLQEFSSATSTSLDGGALAKLNTTLRDLKALAGSPPSAKAGSLAMSIASSLKGLESLAQTTRTARRKRHATRPGALNSNT